MTSSPDWVSVRNATISVACVHDVVSSALVIPVFFSNHSLQSFVYFPSPLILCIFDTSAILSASPLTTEGILNKIIASLTSLLKVYLSVGYVTIQEYFFILYHTPPFFKYFRTFPYKKPSLGFRTLLLRIN